MKPKLLFSDMEGVIYNVGFFEESKNVGASTWTVIHKKLNCMNEDKRMKAKWNSGQYEKYSDWGKECVEVFSKYGLDRKMFLDIINNIPLMKGAKRTFEEIKDRGYTTAIITGGFKTMGQKAQEELGIDYVTAAHTLKFNNNGKLLGVDIIPCDYEGKVRYANDLCSKLGLKLKNCKLIADGVNDIPFAKAVGFSIAFNARDELKQVSDVSIDKKDLSMVLEYL